MTSRIALDPRCSDWGEKCEPSECFHANHQILTRNALLLLNSRLAARPSNSSSSRLAPPLIKRLNMAWPFCPHCRATLRLDSSGSIDCDVCRYSSNLSQMDELPSTTTYSSTRPMPLWAKTEEEQKALRQAKDPVRATIEEPCVKCGHPEVGYYTVQLRSVDEGSTVFYECPSCKHTWSINN